MIPGIPWLMRFFAYVKTSRYIAGKKFKNNEELFTDYYNKKFWGTDESASGHGSTVIYTQKLREGIEGLIKEKKIKSILDAPCGDYNWFRHVNRGDVHYIGGDIVDAMIKDNQDKFGSDNTRFIKIDIINNELPVADMWLCRDVLFHFSYRDIVKALNNFLNSDIPYLLTTSHTEHKVNKDIITGNYRLLNLEKSPFNFDVADLYIEDWIEGYAVRNVCLWHKESIRAKIESLNALLK
jgi:hypothetical protein